MRTSCRFAVAVHVLAVLAFHEGEAVTSARLASSVNTNAVVIRRLLLLLQAAGLVTTTQGARSGSRLRHSPPRISLADVYRAVETEEPFAAHSKAPNLACPVGQSIRSALEKVFLSAEKAMHDELAKTSLADVVKTIHRSCSQKAAERQ